MEMIEHIDRLCTLFMVVASSEPGLTPLYPLRKKINLLSSLWGNSNCGGNQVYASIMRDEKYYLLSVMLIAWLSEDFPLDSFI